METVKQENNSTQQQAQVEEKTFTQQQAQVEEKTFTQSELDAIVTDRLKREKAKYQDFESLKQKAEAYDKLEEANKTELQKATEKATALEVELNRYKQAEEVRAIRDKVARELGVPSELLSGSTEEACKEQATLLLAYKDNSQVYPKLKDGGEISRVNKGSTRQQFADWANQVF